MTYLLFLRINLFLYALPLGVSNLGFCESHIGKEKVSVSVIQYFIEFVSQIFTKNNKRKFERNGNPDPKKIVPKLTFAAHMNRC